MDIIYNYVSMGPEDYIGTTKLNPERHEAIIALLLADSKPIFAFQSVGLSESTYYDWKRQAGEAVAPFSHLFEDIKKAQSVCLASNLELIKAAAVGGGVTTRKTTTKRDGSVEVIETMQGPQWQAGAWLAERTYPDEYGRKNRFEMTGKDGGPVEVSLADVARAAEDEPETSK